MIKAYPHVAVNRSAARAARCLRRAGSSAAAAGARAVTERIVRWIDRTSCSALCGGGFHLESYKNGVSYIMYYIIVYIIKHGEKHRSVSSTRIDHVSSVDKAD